MKKMTETYSISLLLDDFSASQIRENVQKLSEITGNFYLTENSAPPHITLGMFHSSPENLNELRECFSDFSKSFFQDFSVSFSNFDNFLKKVIFLTVEKSEHLEKINSQLHEFLINFEMGGNRNYLPENFFPHVALAVKLNQVQFEKGYSHLTEFSIPKSAKIDKIVLARCKPFKEIDCVELN